MNGVDISGSLPMGRYVLILLLSLLLVSSGCGDNPRVDASNDQTLNASLKKMMADMSETEKKQFKTEYMAVAIASSKDKPAPTSESQLLKALNGMSVDDIHAKAEEVRRSVKEARKSK
jgi:hypothetical protein